MLVIPAKEYVLPTIFEAAPPPPASPPRPAGPAATPFAPPPQPATLRVVTMLGTVIVPVVPPKKTYSYTAGLDPPVSDLEL
jgi:hypothetical protein